MSLFRKIDLSWIGGAALAFGQALKAASIPVVLASDDDVAAATGATAAVPPGRLMQVGGWIFGANKSRAIEIDSCNGLVMIPTDHHEIHEGYAFAARDPKATVASGASRDIYILVGTGDIHAMVVIDASLGGEWFLYEAPTINANGTAIAAYNRDRSSANASTTLVYGGPTVGATGTRIDGGIVGGGTGVNRSGGAVSRGQEWELTAATKYLLRFTSANNSNDVVMGLDWYSAHDANGAHVL